MIPLRDDNPTRRPAVVTKILIALNILIFILIQPHGDSEAIVKLPGSNRVAETMSQGPFAYWQAAIPCEVMHNEPLSNREIKTETCDTANASEASQTFDKKQPLLALLTSMFLHGGYLHLAGNMLFLWIFGDNIEDRLGKLKYLAFYLAAGIVATLAHILADRNSTIPVVGASGAIAGVMGAYLVLFPKVRITSVLAFLPIFPIRLRAWMLLAIWFASQFVINPNSGVAWVAHVGGFVFGALACLVFRRWFDNDDAPVASSRALYYR